ncbi:MAG: DUF1178 family protein [Rhodospirillales bacterium]|nr:DUF1178 family protein [Rhodospirillales bacterium]
MILYQLRCRQAHDFEAWFLDSATFDRQAASGDVTCPYCGSAKIAKAPMAPRLASGSSRGDEPREPAKPAGRFVPGEARATEVAAKILQAVEAVREHVEDTCDYVGDEFADEARRIRKGEAEERGIYGEASETEAAKLDDEGIKVFRLPFVRPRSKN